MADNSTKKPSKNKGKKRVHETVAGFSRFLYAMNLMLEAASAQSRHGLTRYETLLLSVFRNGMISRKRVDEEFRDLLAVHAGNRPAGEALKEAFNGLVKKGLIKTMKRSVEITREGRAELQRLSEIVDAIYDQLVDNLRSPEREELLELFKKIGSR